MATTVLQANEPKASLRTSQGNTECSVLPQRLFHKAKHCMVLFWEASFQPPPPAHPSIVAVCFLLQRRAKDTASTYTQLWRGGHLLRSGPSRSCGLSCFYYERQALLVSMYSRCDLFKNLASGPVPESTSTAMPTEPPQWQQFLGAPVSHGEPLWAACCENPSSFTTCTA